MEQNNNPRHSSKCPTEWLRKKRVKALQWPTQSNCSPVLNPTEMLWHDKWLQTSRNWINIVKKSEPEFLHNDTRDRRSHTEKDYFNLLQIVAAKGGSTSYWILVFSSFFIGDMYKLSFHKTFVSIQSMGSSLNLMSISFSFSNALLFGCSLGRCSLGDIVYQYNKS